MSTLTSQQRVWSSALLGIAFGMIFCIYLSKLKADANRDSPNPPSPDKAVKLDILALPETGITRFDAGEWKWYSSPPPRPEDIAKNNATAIIKFRTIYSDGNWFYDSLWLESDETKDLFQVITATKRAPVQNFFPGDRVNITRTATHLILE